MVTFYCLCSGRARLWNADVLVGILLLIADEDVRRSRSHAS